MKADRKRLASEKIDLVSQMKELYNTLKNKESELRDFIRNYEQRTKDNNDLIKQVSSDSLRNCRRETARRFVVFRNVVTRKKPKHLHLHIG